jgi:DNA-binding transcriptional LysR family regulator
LRTLRMFIDVPETQSFTAAARLHGCTSSPEGATKQARMED